MNNIFTIKKKSFHFCSGFLFNFIMLGFLLLSNGCVQEKEDGLVAYWKFDEGKGTVARDASGNGHDGTVNDAMWVPGKINNALSFEKNGFVEIPDHQELRLQKDFTITAWIKKTQMSQKGKSMGIVSKSSHNAWNYDLFMSTSIMEHPAFYSDAFNESGGDIEIISTIPITLNKWYHIAVIRKGSKAKIYIDGVVTGTANLPEDLATSPKNLFIGHDHDGGFKGSIDEVRIYNRALTGKEISAVMNGQYDARLSFNHVIIDTSFGGALEVTDIDGDKCPDIVHAFWYNGAPLAWYEYRNADTWDRHIIRENFYPVTDNFEIADMDGDDDPDIIMAKSKYKRSDDPKVDEVHIDEVEIVWYENPRPQHDPRTLTWKEHRVGVHIDSKENYVKDIKVADFTGNGKPEIVIRSNVAVSVFHRDESYSWRQIQYIEIHPNEGMAVGDVDCDGDPDIVLNGFWLECPDDPVNGIWTEHNIDKKWYTQIGDWTANSCKVLVKDINGDGCANVLFSHSERAGYPISWYEMTNSNKDSWKEHVIGTVDFCHTLQAGDINLDGNIDIIAGGMEKSNNPEIVVFLNDVDSLSWDKYVIANTSIYSGKVADIGNDGDLDILGNRDWNKPPLNLWENLNENISK